MPEITYEKRVDGGYTCNSPTCAACQAAARSFCKVCAKPVREGLLYCSGLSECWRKGERPKSLGCCGRAQKLYRQFLAGPKSGPMYKYYELIAYRCPDHGFTDV